jgi:hypothetical protein
LRAVLASSLFLIATIAATASAAEDPANPGCSTILGAAERLACYDKLFPPASGAASIVDREAQRVKALQDFGLSHAQVVSREPEETRAPEFDQIAAHVLRVSERADGNRVVTLDNGQTWLLTEGTSKGWLRPGDAISIRKAALGTFLLMTPSRFPLRARRIQ